MGECVLECQCCVYQKKGIKSAFWIDEPRNRGTRPMSRVTYIERLFLEPGEFSSERTRRRARRLAKRCPRQTELKNTIRNAPDGALYVRGMGGNRLEVLTVVKKTGGGTSLTRHGHTPFGSPAHKLAFLRGARSGDRLLNKEIREHFSKLTEEHDEMFNSFYSPRN